MILISKTAEELKKREKKELTNLDMESSSKKLTTIPQRNIINTEGKIVEVQECKNLGELT